MTKRKINQPVSAYIDLEGTVVQIIADLQKLVAEHGPTIRIANEQDAYSDSYSNNLYTEREETNEEYQARTVKEHIEAEARRQRDLTQLKRLKEKYGDVQ